MRTIIICSLLSTLFVALAFSNRDSGYQSFDSKLQSIDVNSRIIQALECVPPEFTPRHEVPLPEALQGIRRTGRFLGMAENLANRLHDTSKTKQIYNMFWQYMAHAYYIPANDLRAVLDTINDTIPSGARVYVSVDCGRLHLYMVPTLNETTDMRKLDANSMPFVYDFITPCPNTCAPVGSLYEKEFRDGKAHPFRASDLIDCPGKACENWNNADLKKRD